VKQRWFVRIGEREHQVTVTLDPSDPQAEARVEVDGVAHHVVPAPGRTALVVEDRTGQQHDIVVDDPAKPRQATLRGVPVDVEAQSAAQRALARSRNKSVSGAGAGKIKAPMPGRIVRVHASVGAVVQAGAPLVIVEAMKMENELSAPMAGVVVSISVSEGQAVDAGALLIELAPPPAE
jgi:biotin carboxyl carrier protein